MREIALHLVLTLAYKCLTQLRSRFEQLNYQFLLLTHLVCADQQIHSEETKALRQLAKEANIKNSHLIISRNGRFIAFETNRYGQWDIAIYDRGLETELSLP